MTEGGKKYEKAEVPPAKQDDNDDDDVWYFAIGSMMLPLSYERRGIYPKESYPAELYGYKLGFFGPDGYAEAIPSVGKSMHGVLHRVSSEHMKELDKIEGGYDRQTGQARPYGTSYNGSDNRISCTVYVRPKDDDNNDNVNRPPQQRYIEIMVAGARHFGVDSKYIQGLLDHENQPRTQPKDFLSFGDPPSKTYTETTIPESTVANIYFAMNGRVMKLSYPSNHHHGPFFLNMRQTHGVHFEIGMSNFAYDPKYGFVNSIEECTLEHRGYLEDKHYRFCQQLNVLQYYEIVGYFEYE